MKKPPIFGAICYREVQIPVTAAILYSWPYLQKQNQRVVVSEIFLNFAQLA
jgi:hypothetical protein